MSKILDVFTKEYKEETRYRECMKENVNKIKLGTTPVNQGGIGCQNCVHRENDANFGLICQHKSSMEGIEAEKEFYKVSEVTECSFYEYDKDSVIDR